MILEPIVAIEFSWKTMWFWLVSKPILKKSIIPKMEYQWEEKVKFETAVISEIKPNFSSLFCINYPRSTTFLLMSINC